MAEWSSPMPKSPSADLDQQFDLLRTAVEALAADLNELTSGVGIGQFPSMETKLRWKRNVAFAAGLMVRAVDALMPAAGAGGLSSHAPLQRQFRDIHAASAHIALTWDVHAAAYGRSALGLPPPGGLLLL